MAYWLLKSEPDSFSWSDQVARNSQGEPWTGVRNHQAKNFILQMQAGDQAFFYHTAGEKRIVGIVDIVSAPFPDPSDGAWYAVTTVAKAKFENAVGLIAIKANPKLAEMALLKQSRLSVQPVNEAQWTEICRMAGAQDHTA